MVEEGDDSPTPFQHPSSLRILRPPPISTINPLPEEATEVVGSGLRTPGSSRRRTPRRSHWYEDEVLFPSAASPSVTVPSFTHKLAEDGLPSYVPPLEEEDEAKRAAIDWENREPSKMLWASIQNLPEEQKYGHLLAVYDRLSNALKDNEESILRANKRLRISLPREKELERVQMDIIQLRDEKNELDRQLYEMHLNEQNTRDELERQRQDFRRIVAEKENKLNAVQFASKTHGKEAESESEIHINFLEEAMVAKEEQLEENSKAIAKLQKELAFQTQKVAKLEESRQAVEADVDMYMDHIKDLEAEVQQLTSQQSRASVDEDMLKERDAIAEQKLNELKAQFDSAEQQKLEWMEASVKFRSENGNLTNIISQRDRELERISHLLEECKAKMVQEADAKQQHIDGLGKKVSELENRTVELDQTIASLEDARLQGLDENGRLKDQLEEKEELLSALKTSVEEEKDRANEVRDGLSRIIAGLEKQLESEKEQSQHTQTRLEGLTARERERSQEMQTRLEEQLAREKKQSQEAQIQLEGQLTEKRDQLQNMQAQLKEQLANERNDSQNTQAQLEEQLATQRGELQKRQGQLEEQLARERERSQEVHTRLEEQLAKQREQSQAQLEEQLAKEREEKKRLDETQTWLEEQLAKERKQSLETQTRFEDQLTKQREQLQARLEEQLEKQREQSQAQLEEQLAKERKLSQETQTELEKQLAKQGGQSQTRIEDQLVKERRQSQERQALLEAVDGHIRELESFSNTNHDEITRLGGGIDFNQRLYQSIVEQLATAESELRAAVRAQPDADDFKMESLRQRVAKLHEDQQDAAGALVDMRSKMDIMSAVYEEETRQLQDLRRRLKYPDQSQLSPHQSTKAIYPGCHSEVCFCTLLLYFIPDIRLYRFLFPQDSCACRPRITRRDQKGVEDGGQRKSLPPTSGQAEARPPASPQPEEGQHTQGTASEADPQEETHTPPPNPTHDSEEHQAHDPDRTRTHHTCHPATATHHALRPPPGHGHGSDPFGSATRLLCQALTALVWLTLLVLMQPYNLWRLLVSVTGYAGLPWYLAKLALYHVVRLRRKPERPTLPSAAAMVGAATTLAAVFAWLALVAVAFERGIWVEENGGWRMAYVADIVERRPYPAWSPVEVDFRLLTVGWVGRGLNRVFFPERYSRLW